MSDECPYWNDGKHCFTDPVVVLGMIHGPHQKRCSCGATVEPKPAPATQVSE